MSLIIGDWLDDVLAAAAFLTRVPVPHLASPPNLARAYRAFPLLGAAIGAAVGAVDLLLLWIGLPAIAAAALALGAGAMLTGALHEDALAALADGFGGSRDKAAKLDVMRDSRLGTYGSLALMTSFVAKIGALTTLPRSEVLVAMIATHALARAPLAVLAAAMPYTRADGLAASAGRPDSVIASMKVEWPAFTVERWPNHSPDQLRLQQAPPRGNLGYSITSSASIPAIHGAVR